MKSKTARLAIIRASDRFSERRIARALPPEHRIVGSNAEPDIACVKWLIEGPSIALCDPLDPPIISPLFTMEMPDGGRIRLTGNWERYSPETSWTIGEWDSVGAYSNEMDGLDA